MLTFRAQESNKFPLKYVHMLLYVENIRFKLKCEPINRVRVILSHQARNQPSDDGGRFS